MKNNENNNNNNKNNFCFEQFINDVHKTQYIEWWCVKTIKIIIDKKRIWRKRKTTRTTRYFLHTVYIFRFIFYFFFSVFIWVVMLSVCDVWSSTWWIFQKNIWINQSIACKEIFFRQKKMFFKFLFISNNIFGLESLWSNATTFLVVLRLFLNS